MTVKELIKELEMCYPDHEVKISIENPYEDECIALTAEISSVFPDKDLVTIEGIAY